MMNLKEIQFLALCLLFCISLGDARAPKKVIRGEDAGKGEFLYQVHITNFMSKGICGGAIIDDTHILTAAHCVVGSTFLIAGPQDLEVWTGTIDSQDTGYRKSLKIAKVIPHENYNPTINRQINYFADIAILKLAEKIVFTSHEKAIDLPSSETLADKHVVASGWGRVSMPNETRVNARLLQKLNMYTISLDECKKTVNNRVGDGHICAIGGRGTGNCDGDSGSPLTYKNQIIGILSFGKSPCASDGYPDIFTSVYYYLKWIRAVMQRH